MYGLRHKETKKLLSIGLDIVETDDSTELVHEFVELIERAKMIWLVEDKSVAENALKNNTKYLYSEYVTPSHGAINMSQYEVAAISISSVKAKTSDE